MQNLITEPTGILTVAEDDSLADVKGRAKRFYRPELDMLRFFAFLLVFYCHAFPQTSEAYMRLGPQIAEWMSSIVKAGGLGVDLFFTLSAYLITELLIREHERFGRINVRDFYVRRALRIYPLYYGFLALVLVLSAIGASAHLSLGYWLLFVLPLGNWACVLWGFPPSVTAHLWSVSIEEQFYFTYPLLLRFVGVKRIVIVAGAMFIISNITRVIAVWVGAEHPAIWCNTLARLDPIVCGMLAAFWLRGEALRISNLGRIMMAAGGVLLLFVTARYARVDGLSSLIFYPAIAAATTIILLASLMHRAVARNLFTTVLIYLGRISYGLYVWHLLALDLAERLKFGNHYLVTLATRVIIGFILTVAFSVLSYELYESYFLKLKERFTFIPSRPV